MLGPETADESPRGSRPARGKSQACWVGGGARTAAHLEVIAMNLIGNAFVTAVAFSALAVAACSSTHGPAGSLAGSHGPGGGVGQLAQDGTGQVGLHLTLAPGVSLTSVSWTIQGPNMYS